MIIPPLLWISVRKSPVNHFDKKFTLLQDTVLDAAEQIETEPQILFEIEDKDEICDIKLKL